MIRLETIEDPQQFYSIRQEWNTLLEKSRLNNPFLRHEWLAAWWKAFGKNKELFVVRFKRNRETIGFAPLMKYNTKLTGVPVKAIGFISNHWTRMDFILTERRENCLSKVADIFISTKMILILAQMDSESENFNLLKKILINKKNDFSETQKQNAYMQIGGTWNEYLKNRSRNFRMDFNKKLRRLNKIAPVCLNSGYNDSDSIIPQLCSVSEKSWQTKNNVNIVSKKSGQLFYKEIIKEWGGKDMLDFSMLEIGNKAISYMVGVKSNGCYFAFDTAYNKDFQKYSPGMLIHNLLLKRLFDNKMERFDFGYIANYKKRWTEKTFPITNLTIFAKGPIGRLLWIINRIKNSTKNDKDQ